MRSTTYNRYLWLLNTLLPFNKLTLEEIQQRWEASSLYEGRPLLPRTFHNIRHAVEEMFQVSIECDVNNGYRYYIEGAPMLTKDKNRQWLLNSFNVAELVRQGQGMQDRIVLEDIPGGSEFLSLVIDAMKANKELEVQYRAFDKIEPAIYHFQPYCMRVRHQRWYMLGRLKGEDGKNVELRHLALDRVLDMQMTDVSFKYPKNFSPDEFYRNSVGIYVNGKDEPQDVVIRVDASESKYFDSLPLHPSQKKIKETVTHTDYKYHVCVTRDLTAELLRKGDTVEVLEPAELRKKMVILLKKALNRYGSDAELTEKEEKKLDEEELMKEFKAIRAAHRQKLLEQESDYVVTRVNSSEELQPWERYNNWCLNVDQGIFDFYMENGVNHFYVAERSDMRSLQGKVTPHTPYDDYGYSLIGIIVKPDGTMNTVSRWNNPAEKDEFIPIAKLRELLGKEFLKLK